MPLTRYFHRCLSLCSLLSTKPCSSFSSLARLYHHYPVQRLQMSTTSKGFPRILSIQSHIVHGFVGNKAAAFPLQTMGYDVDCINTVTLSNHPAYVHSCKGAGLEPSVLKDLLLGLQENDLLKYDLLMSGYTRQKDHLLAVADTVQLIRSTTNPDLIYICDPVLGDNGSYYVPEELCALYQTRMLPLATVITPNVFETQVLSGATQPVTTLTQALQACQKLHDLGPEMVILTGLPLENPHTVGENNNMLSAVVSYRPKSSQAIVEEIAYLIECPKLPGALSGCGDLFSALVTPGIHQSLAAARKQHLRNNNDVDHDTMNTNTIHYVTTAASRATQTVARCVAACVAQATTTMTHIVTDTLQHHEKELRILRGRDLFIAHEAKIKDIVDEYFPHNINNANHYNTSSDSRKNQATYHHVYVPHKRHSRQHNHNYHHNSIYKERQVKVSLVRHRHTPPSTATATPVSTATAHSSTGDNNEHVHLTERQQALLNSFAIHNYHNTNMYNNIDNTIINGNNTDLISHNVHPLFPLAVIFDMDGTLTLPGAIDFAGMKKALKAAQAELTQLLNGNNDNSDNGSNADHSINSNNVRSVLGTHWDTEDILTFLNNLLHTHNQQQQQQLLSLSTIASSENVTTNSYNNNISSYNDHLLHIHSRLNSIVEAYEVEACERQTLRPWLSPLLHLLRSHCHIRLAISTRNCASATQRFLQMLTAVSEAAGEGQTDAGSSSVRGNNSNNDNGNIGDGNGDNHHGYFDVVQVRNEVSVEGRLVNKPHPSVALQLLRQWQLLVRQEAKEDAEKKEDSDAIPNSNNATVDADANNGDSKTTTSSINDTITNRNGNDIVDNKTLAAHLAYPYGQVVFVGDSMDDMKCGRAAGLTTIFLKNDKDNLAVLDCPENRKSIDFVVQDLNELALLLVGQSLAPHDNK